MEGERVEREGWGGEGAEGVYGLFTWGSGLEACVVVYVPCACVARELGGDWGRERGKAWVEFQGEEVEVVEID